MPNFRGMLTVLVVEERAKDYMLTKKYLQEEFAFAEICNAATLSEAKDCLKQNPDIQIILLGLSVSNIKGEGFIKSILKFADTIPVIVLTGFADKDFGIKTLSMGVADYLFKEGLTGIQLYKSIVHSIERNRIHVKLNESEEKYKNLFNLSPLPQWVYDLETLRFLNVNEAAVIHYGYNREEFMAMTIKDIRPDEDSEVLQRIIDNDVKLGEFNKSFVRHQKKNGEIINVKVEGNSINFEGENARLVMVVDITESMQAQEALKKSEHRFKALVQEGSDLIGIMDKDGICTYVSPTTEVILGIKSEVFFGNSVFDFIHKDDIDRILNEFEALGTKRRIELSPFRFLDGNNQYRWIESIVTDMSDDPVIAGIVTNSRDITSRIENEIKTKESIDRYSAVSKATSDAIYEWDFATDVVKWNRGIRGIFGYKKITNTNSAWWKDHVHPKDVKNASENLQLLIKNKKERLKHEYRFRCEDGCYKYVLDRSFVIYNKEREPIKMIGSMQDITGTVHYIKEIEAHNHKLKEISWTQSHKVRAPLARIMGLIEILNNCQNEEENLSQMLEYITSSANELDEVICSIINPVGNPTKD